MSKGLSQAAYVAMTFILLALMVLVAIFVPTRLGLRWWLWAWIAELVLMFVILGLIGLSIGSANGWWAVFVDSRNMVSLSRFQVVLWTLVVLSAFWTIGLGRVADSTHPDHAKLYVCEPTSSNEQTPCATPLSLGLPVVLWALMGISVTSAVATPLIREDKVQRTSKDQKDYEDALTKTLTRNKLAQNFGTRGAVVIRTSGSPSFGDMFRGEDPENVCYIDIAKVQNFFFTIVAVIAYGVALGAAIVGAESIASLCQFPAVAEGLLAVLGISHAGYLVNQTITSKPG